MPMKKILIVQGGGRPYGNTSQLVRSFQRGAEEAGHQVEILSLIQSQVNGCLGCNVCRYGKPCVQKDNFADMIPKIMESDCIVLASPLYYWTIPARLKAFMERFYCIAQPDPHPPMGRVEKYPEKDCALLMTSAANTFWAFEQAVSFYRLAVVNYIGFHDKGILLAGGCGNTNGGPKIERTGYLQKAFEFGKQIYPEESNTDQ